MSLQSSVFEPGQVASEDGASGDVWLARIAILAFAAVLLSGVVGWAVFGPAVAFDLMVGAIWNCF